MQKKWIKKKQKKRAKPGISELFFKIKGRNTKNVHFLGQKFRFQK